MVVRMLLALFVICTLFITGCKKTETPSSSPARSSNNAIPVTTQQVQLQLWNDSVSALGTVKARESVTLTAKVSEIVDKVHFDSGDKVNAGATLVTLRQSAQSAALAQAQATYEEANSLFKRQEELAGQQLVARSALDSQRALRDSAKARVDQMRSDIGDRSVRAPFAGVLGIRQVSPGALITPNTTIATLDDISKVYVDFPVPESQLAQVQNGHIVVAHSVAYPNRTFEGKVTTVDSRVNSESRAVMVRAEFNNADLALRSGMLLEVNLLQPDRQAVVIPEIAVVQLGRESFVFRVKNTDQAERIVVQTGGRRDGRVEILQGLNAGESIVIDGIGKLRDGSKIQADTGSTSPKTEEKTP